MDAWAVASRSIGWPDKSYIPEGVKLNLGCGKIILNKEEGWVNVDKLPLDGVDVRHDLFTFPWPFDNNYADYIMASHIVEHIPHEVMYRVSNAISGPIPANTSVSERVKHYWDRVNIDGFFAFFREVHRILKPTGKITVLCPYGLSTGALQDPTHTRYLVPATFGYLTKDSGGDYFDYGIDFAFELVDEGLTIFGNPWLEYSTPVERDWHMQHTFDAACIMRVNLRPVK